MEKVGYLFVNFGGPRSLGEVAPFLQALLTDQEVIRTKLPRGLHKVLFSYIAKRRAKKVQGDYAFIGGKSPIFEDTEAVAKAFREKTGAEVRTFHRYLPATHTSSLELIEKMGCEKIVVFPFFPQFTYATTGSIAAFFNKHLSEKTLRKLRWVKSYPAHSAFVELTQQSIKNFMEQEGLKDSETLLLFSPHGLPQKFIDEGGLYEEEVMASFNAVMAGFEGVLGRVGFQSKFGRGEWLKPYTIDLCTSIKAWAQGRKNVVFVPISFTSDHIETLFEIEREYMPVIKGQGLIPYRLPAIGAHPKWLEAIEAIINSATPVANAMLVRCLRCRCR